MKKKPTKWLEEQIEKMQIELECRTKRDSCPKKLAPEKRDFSYLDYEVSTFVENVWRGNDVAFFEESFRDIFIFSLRTFYGWDIWEKIKNRSLVCRDSVG